MTNIKASKKDVWFLVSRAFPEYTGRKFKVAISGTVGFHDLNWGGGTRNQFIAVPLVKDGQANSLPECPPWANPIEGQTIAIPQGWAVIEHPIFCGHDMGVTIHVGTDDMAKLLPNGILESRKARLTHLAELRAKHPELLQLSDTNQNRLTTAAKNIRKELASAFPGVKFTIRTKRFSGGDDLNVDWTDGPTSAKVKAITDKYSGGDFDGMTDSYTHSRSAWIDVFGQSKYVFENRGLSVAFITRVRDEMNFAGDFPVVESCGHGYFPNRTPETEAIMRKAYETDA